MAFSMHSHSGQFCPGHAKDDLEEVIQRAIELKMRLFALTEHMPRTDDEDLYPEEISAGHTISLLLPRHKAYIQEATRLRSKYASQIQILIGFEGEWIRRSSYFPMITALLSPTEYPSVDFFVASVHHVHGVPIDYDKDMYSRAIALSSGDGKGVEEALFEAYFDAQFEMLNSFLESGVGVGRMVVGHFDLIRLLSENPDRDLRTIGEGRVWGKVVRNLEVVKRLDGLLEVNSAGLRKGLREPYPGRSVVEEFLKMGGKFTLSDDSHGVAHVGSYFKETIQYLEDLGVRSLHHFERRVTVHDGDSDSSLLVIVSVPLEELKTK